jgi:hypothetical protein
LQQTAEVKRPEPTFEPVWPVHDSSTRGRTSKINFQREQVDQSPMESEPPARNLQMTGESLQGPNLPNSVWAVMNQGQALVPVNVPVNFVILQPVRIMQQVQHMQREPSCPSNTQQPKFTPAIIESSAGLQQYREWQPGNRAWC